jgi:hypothetical protein
MERLKGVRIYEAYNAGSVVPLTVISFQVKERIDKSGKDKETAFMKVITYEELLSFSNYSYN